MNDLISQHWSFVNMFDANVDIYSDDCGLAVKMAVVPK